MQAIEQKHPLAELIYIICDNARYYLCHLVKAYLRNSRIILIFLPPYSPNLNLIERYWLFFRKQVLYGKYYERFDDFKHACDAFFAQSVDHVTALRSLLTENFQILSGPAFAAK